MFYQELGYQSSHFAHSSDTKDTRRSFWVRAAILIREENFVRLVPVRKDTLNQRGLERFSLLGHRPVTVPFLIRRGSKTGDKKTYSYKY